MNMHAMNKQLTMVVGADWTLPPWHHNSSNVGGVTAGQARHNSSYDNAILQNGNASLSFHDIFNIK